MPFRSVHEICPNYVVKLQELSQIQRRGSQSDFVSVHAEYNFSPLVDFIF